MKTITDVDVAGKRVFCRVDFNVPLNEMQEITDDARIRAVLPTIEYILKNQGRLVLASHLGRPEGERVEKFSLAPVAKRLSSLIQKEVNMAPDCIGPEVAKMVSQTAPGNVVLLENLRFHKAEEKNEPEFAQQLAALCDVYVNDAFAVSHRANASVEAIVAYVATAATGVLLQKEIDYFQKAMVNPKRPLAAVVGGAKVSSKLPALINIMKHVDKVIVGGAMANTFLKAKGVGVGKSKIEEDLIDAADDIMKEAAVKGIKFYLPVDVVVAETFDQNAAVRTVPIQEIPEDWMALDIGPATSLVYSEALNDANTIVWNGPMGVFEMEPFSHGTMAMARSIADADALTIVGGGDTDAALHQAGKTDQVSYVSTGGGAFLSLLEGKELPAVAALQAAANAASGR